MTKRLLSLLAAAVLALTLFAGCAKKTPTRYKATFLTLFDTVTVVTGFETDAETFDATAQHIHDELLVYHELYDIYNDYEGVVNIKTINDNAGVAPVKVDEKIIDMLTLAVDMCARTGGKVNVAMGSVLSLWHDAREYGINNPEDAYLPSDEDLAAAAQHTDINDVIIDREAGTVYLADPDMRLDVGAVGKGYAVEQVCETLESEGVTSYVLSVGGNVRAIGPKADGTDWTVGIENPWSTSDTDTYLLTVGIRDMSVVTSGSYQRYYTVNGVQYHHIIDPQTLYPKNEYVSVTVLAHDSGLADALSTALFNSEYEDGLALVRSLDGVEAMWVYADGTRSYSDGFRNYILEED
ncbi:MAG: FAD:protein FMN transferase [Oscillospiraceae bacterium]|nr:FAD:protein FMN transferase [Oscillospiraceae bacterium]